MEKQAVILATLASKRKKKLSDRKKWRQWSSESFREYPIIEQGLKSQLPKWNWTETNSTIILSDSFIKLEDYPILVMPSHPSALTYLHILSYWFWRSENRLETSITSHGFTNVCHRSLNSSSCLQWKWTPSYLHKRIEWRGSVCACLKSLGLEYVTYTKGLPSCDVSIFDTM
jgi:hypothetical protein